MDGLGLGYARLSELDPALVYCSITGFGSGGGAALPGYDLLVQAVGGLMSITGPPDGEPQKVGVALVDILAGLFASVGILAALRHRERTGEGQLVEVDLMSSLLAALVNQASAYTIAGVVPGRLGNAHPSITPYELFETGDGELVLAVGNERQFAALCDVLGAPEVIGDPRFATNSDRVTHRAQLREALVAKLASRAAADWAGELTRARVPAGVVNDVGGAFALAESLGMTPIVGVPAPDGSVRAPAAQSDRPLAHAADLPHRPAAVARPLISPDPPAAARPAQAGGSAASIAATTFGSSGVTLVGKRAISLPSPPTRYFVKFQVGGPELGWRARSSHSGDGSARTDVGSVSGKVTP